MLLRYLVFITTQTTVCSHWILVSISPYLSKKTSSQSEVVLRNSNCKRFPESLILDCIQSSRWFDKISTHSIIVTSILWETGQKIDRVRTVYESLWKWIQFSRALDFSWISWKHQKFVKFLQAIFKNNKRR